MQFEPLHAKENSNASISSKKENKPPHVISKENISASETLCSASKDKPTAVHSQPIDHLKYMEPSLSLVKGIPMEAPKSLRSPNKDIVVHFKKENAAERTKTNIPPQSQTLVNSARDSQGELTHTLLKPPSLSPPLRNGLGNIGPVAWAKKTLASKQSRQSEETVALNLDQRKSKVLIFRASSMDSEVEIPKDHRRLGGSEPGTQTKFQDRSPRKFSRSLYDDPQRRKKLLEPDHAKRMPNKDPLASISQEEDLASLTELAQALDIPDEQVFTNFESKTESVKQGAPCTPTFEKGTAATDGRGGVSNSKNSEHENRGAEVRGQGINHATKQRTKNVHEKEPSQSKLHPKSHAASRDTTLARTPTPKRISASTDSVTPKSKTYQTCNSAEIDSANLPASPSSRFSALVAKFNNPSSQATPEGSPSRLSKKLLTTVLAEDNQKRINTPKKGLVAPYTTNPPSPAKSQKSGKSDNSPQSIRCTLTTSFKADGEESPGSSRGVSPVRKDVLASRRVRKSPGNVDVSSKQTSSSTRRQSSPVICRQPPCPVEATSPTETSPPNEGLECPFLVQKNIETTPGEKDESPFASGPSIQARTEHVTTSSMEMLSSKDSPVLSEAVAILSPMVAREVPIFDGSAAALDNKKLPISFLATEAELLRAKSSPSLLDTASFVHPDSPFRETFANSNPASPAGSPPLPSRSNSVLYVQIRTLQRKLSSKTEEARKLKKELDARGSLNIGTLSKQLREAKREIQFWKTRAEVAEKQIENFTKLPSREGSRQASKDLSSKSSLVLTRASTGYAGEAGDMAARIRKALHGMDGTESPAPWSSEESSHTVIREGIQGSQCGI